MITPFEIENKEFSKSMRGYNAEEVDDFLDLIILDLQKLLAENDRLKGSIKSLESDLAQYKRSETSVLNTLESAKKLMNDISESAEKRAEIIIRNAQMEADSITRDARENISKLIEEGDKLKYKVSKFRDRYRQLLEDQLSQVEGSSEELFDDLEREFMPASMEKSTPKPAAASASTPSVERILGEAPIVKEPKMGDTVVVSGKPLEDMLMENFGVKDSGNPDRTIVKEDMTRTRVVR